jgi:NAD+ synthase
MVNVRDRIIEFLNDYKNNTNCKGVVLGISGGKDSTVVAMLSKLVFGDNVFGVIMPNGIQSDIDDAINVCETLNIDYRVVNINQAYRSLVGSIETHVWKDDQLCEKHIDENCPKISDKAKTNIPPRLRMTTLYAIAQTLGYRVIGTGNASERYIGWFTKYGDGGCDLNLEGLLNADDFNFSHDICGIHNNLDRENKKLNNNFLPRFAV